MDQLLELLLSSGALRFGSFKTKSGRLSPYFFDFGMIHSGKTMGALAELYADALAQRFPDVENLYGPAYKGIPLAVAIAEKLAKRLGRDVTFTFNRKEAKDHGEGGDLVGHKYKGGEKVVIVEDVLTGGTSVRESLQLLGAYRIVPMGVMLGLDREEKGTGTKSAKREIEEDLKIRVESLASLSAVIEKLSAQVVCGKRWIDEGMKTSIDAYRKAYG